MAEINNSGTGQWSEVDASNTSANPDGWPAGTFFNAVEPIGRSTMGAIKRFWDRIMGTVTTTGPSGTYLYAPVNTAYPTAYVIGEQYTWKAHQNSAGADTLNINGLGALALYKQNAAGVVAIAAGDIVAGQFVTCMYNGTVLVITNAIGQNAASGANADISSLSALTLIKAPAGTTVLQIAVDGTINFTNRAGSAQSPISVSAVQASAGQLLLQNSTNINCTNIAGSANIPISASAFTVASDYRLKTNIQPLTDALSRLQALPVHRFNWLSSPDSAPVDGFLAHEAQAVVPEAVFGEKDAMEDDKPIYQRIDQSKIVPLLVAAIKELADKISALEVK